MEKITVRLLLCFFLFKSISGTNECRPASCSPTGPQVRFPWSPVTPLWLSWFRPLVYQTKSNHSPPNVHPIIHSQPDFLPRTGASYFASNRNDKAGYNLQIIYINPEFCRANQIIDFSLTGTPFDFSSIRSYTFYNCSLRKSDFDHKFHAVQLRCLDSVNYSVIAVNGSIPKGETPENCRDMAVISVPIRWYGDVKVELELMWVTPFCRYCELEGRACGLKGGIDDGETTCFGSSGGIRRSMYGLILAIVVSILICIVAVVWYVADKRRERNQSLHQNIDVFTITIAPRQRASTGLDMFTIESYTKTILGESRRLPKDDDTCPICLSKYEPKDTLRTIPECNHYFHVGCIDEWLRLNATCPICRNSP